MSTLALSRWSSAAAASSQLYFSAVLLGRRLRRSLRSLGDRRALQAMPDYMLADIGVSRREVDASGELDRLAWRYTAERR